MRLVSAAVLAGVGAALDNGLARTPQMGWNTWNKFACSINETLIREAADALAGSGLRDAGYTYLNVDDCWAASRDTAGSVQPDPVAFPSGMRALGDYIHSLGLRFGIYSDAGALTCAGRPGSLGHEHDDAASYAAWGVDYLKYDNCFSDRATLRDRYTAMRDALNATGRPILFSLCEWGLDAPWEWAADVGNSWRTTGDIADYWESFLRCLDSSTGIARYAGPGAWNDPDMLEVGNGGMNTNEYRSHFALWSILKAPLLVGCDVRTMSQDVRSILLAKEVIAVNQDSLGVAGDCIFHEGSKQVFAGPLADGSRAAVLFNRNDDDVPSNITLSFASMGYHETTKATVRDLFAGKDLGEFQGEFTAAVARHDSLALRITPIDPAERDTTWRPWH